MSRRIIIGHPNPRTHSASSPAPVQTVSVAVLAPHLPKGPAPQRTAGGMAYVFSWDETLNWTHDAPAPASNASSGPGMGVPLQSAGAGAHEAIPGSRRKSSTSAFFKKAGLTTERRKRNPDTPSFVMKEVPFATWRRHYAKDADGNYRGTHAPAEDCLLKEHDVEKWRNKEEDVQGSRWTRGSEALPVYGEVLQDEGGRVPGYEEDYADGNWAVGTGAGRSDSAVAGVGFGGVMGVQREAYDKPPEEEPVFGGGEEGREGYDRPRVEEPVAVKEQRLGLVQERTDRNTGLRYDAQREQEELARRNMKPKDWKAKMKRGLQMGAMGGGGQFRLN